MNAREANVFLTEAALLDPRMKRVDPEDQADMASMWADVLSDVPLEDARAAMRAHYRAQTVAIMPAHVLEHVGVSDVVPSPYVDITDQVIEESKARALAAAGVTAEEFAEHEHDAAWVWARFAPVRETVIGPIATTTTDENGDLE